MKPIYVNRSATVLSGPLAGITGLVVGADSMESEVTLQVDASSYVIIHWDNVKQVEGGKTL